MSKINRQRKEQGLPDFNSSDLYNFKNFKNNPKKEESDERSAIDKGFNLDTDTFEAEFK